VLRASLPEADRGADGGCEAFGTIPAVLVTSSPYDHAETVNRLIAAVERRGMNVFARIDHAAAARDAGLDLADEQVILFGNPRAGTPLMQSDPRIGIELPLRVLVWDSGDGVVLGHNDPRELADLYDVDTHSATLETMSNLLAELQAEVAA
jgi:uncharacterized protein (DUF302 family)